MVVMNKQQRKHFESFQQAWNKRICNKLGNQQSFLQAWMKEWTQHLMKLLTRFWQVIFFGNPNNLESWREGKSYEAFHKVQMNIHTWHKTQHTNDLESKSFQQVNWELKTMRWWNNLENLREESNVHKIDNWKVASSKKLTPKANKCKFSNHLPFSTPMFFAISIASNNLLLLPLPLSRWNFIPLMWQWWSILNNHIQRKCKGLQALAVLVYKLSSISPFLFPKP